MKNIHTNRCINLIEQIEAEQRQAEHNRRCALMSRCEQMFAAAQAEAQEHGVTLFYSCGRYVLEDNRHHVAFYPMTGKLMVARHEQRRLEPVDLNAECDIYDITSMFCEGRFLQ